MTTLKGAFRSSKPHARNFIKENVRHLREIEKYWHNASRPAGSIGNVPPVNLNKATRNSKSAHCSSLPQKISVNRKLSPPKNFKQLNYQEPNMPLKLNRKTKLGGKAKREIEFNEEMLKKSDVAEFVRQQRANVFGRKNNGVALTDSELSIDLSSLDSVKFIKSPGTRTATYRSTSCQTVDPSALDTLYNDGTIRYPTVTKDSASNTRNRLISKKAIQTSKSPTDSPGPTPGRSNTTNSFVPHNLGETDKNAARTNIKPAIPLTRQPNRPLNTGLNVPPTYQRGVLPKYLQKRRDEWQKDNEEKVKNTPDPDCAPGHVPLPDAERKETLKMLRKSYADLVHELNMMPVRTDTLRMRQRKMDLEKQLNKIEDGMKVFSRPKVFVKIGE